MKDDIINNFNEYISKYVKSDRVNHAYLIETNYSDRVKLATILAQRIDSFDSNLSIEEYEKMDDLSIIDPDENVIKTEDIENLKEKFMTKSLTGNKRIYIINNADKMNMYAANKLLKFLEEPEDDIIAILTTYNKNKIIDTIVSRCQILRFFIDENKFDKYDKDYIDELFEFVLNIEENKEKAIAFQNKYDIKKLSERKYLQEFLNNILYIYDDVIKLINNKKIEFFKDYVDELKIISEKNTMESIKNKINAINFCIDRLEYNPNIKLLIDKLIIMMSGVDLNA